ncbi:hypothetical protein CYMTET_39405 [Cymbomonas tetramitiformis]|uniref:Uncharacterized protein n=1 Tax=Cymbomonas tetramitiformis TaxID=36881 RepID=A0AAE0CBG7_9CHLO|nr:hypothetical protein CYMTET_39405 [Cymbomonas tetramitiformis]
MSCCCSRKVSQDPLARSREDPSQATFTVRAGTSYARGRKIDYRILERTNGDTTSKPRAAIVFFYALGGTADIVNIFRQLFCDNDDELAACNREIVILCVNRPGCGKTGGQTAEVSEDEKRESADTEEEELYRNRNSNIRLLQTAEDILHVLLMERIEEVHVLATCLGHPYAMAFVSQYLKRKRQPATSSKHVVKFSLRFPICLVAPWLSVACPQTMGLAQIGGNTLGAESFVVQSVTWITSAFMRVWLGYLAVMPAKTTKDFLMDGMTWWEKNDWDDEDLEAGVEGMKNFGRDALSCAHLEMQMGACSEWQERYVESVIKELVRNGKVYGLDSEFEGTKKPVIQIFNGDCDDLILPCAISWYTRWATDIRETARETLLDKDENCQFMMPDGVKIVQSRQVSGSHYGLICGGGPRRDRKVLKMMLGNECWGLFEPS